MIMNATLHHLRRLGQSVLVGLGTQATPPPSGSTRQRDDGPGSYGRGSYAGRSTYALDFRSQGSYGRGSYAGRSTADHDNDTPGSYGRGSYAGRSTTDIDFGVQGSFASSA
jgi:hypothetical protein